MDIPAQSQCDAEPAYSDSQYLQVCSGKKCNCSDTTIQERKLHFCIIRCIITNIVCLIQNDSCTTIKLRERDEEAPEPTPRNSTGNLFLFEYHYL